MIMVDPLRYKYLRRNIKVVITGRDFWLTTSWLKLTIAVW